MWRILLFTLLVLVLSIGGAFAGENGNTPPPKPAKPVPYTGPKKRIAVMDMEVKVTTTSTTTPNSSGGDNSTSTVSIPMPTDFGTGLTEMLVTALIDTNRFVVLERKNIADIQAEHNLGTNGSVDPDTAVKPGSLLGAQVLMRGAITEYSYRSTTTEGSVSILPISVSIKNTEAMVGLDIRIYDPTTGQVLDSVRAEGTASGSSAGIKLENGKTTMAAAGSEDTPLGKASRQAIQKAVELIIARMELVPWEGAIADIEDTTLYLNAGSDMGLKAGDMLEVFRPGHPIKDPKTKLIIGRTHDTCLGKCKIVSVTKTLALAMPVEGKGFKVDDSVRYIEPPAPATPPVQSTKPATTGGGG